VKLLLARVLLDASQALFRWSIRLASAHLRAVAPPETIKFIEVTAHKRVKLLTAKPNEKLN
jgi:hypothetical protein